MLLQPDADLDALLDIENEQMEGDLSERRTPFVIAKLTHSGFGRGVDG